MRPTTSYLKAEIRRLNVIIERISRKPKNEAPVWAPTLRDLIDEREILGLIVLNRHIEAARPTVNFVRWREGPWAA